MANCYVGKGAISLKIARHIVDLLSYLLVIHYSGCQGQQLCLCMKLYVQYKYISISPTQ